MPGIKREGHNKTKREMKTDRCGEIGSYRQTDTTTVRSRETEKDIERQSNR
jgi:hypothetical protein